MRACVYGVRVVCLCVECVRACVRACVWRWVTRRVLAASVCGRGTGQCGC